MSKHTSFIPKFSQTYGRPNTGPRHRTAKRIPVWEHVASWFGAAFADPLYA